MTDPIPCNCWLDPQPSPTPCVFDDPSEIVDDCTYASNLASAGRPKTACKHYREAGSAAELTDEQLLELAEKELCIDDMKDAHEEHYPIEVVTDGPIAYARAAIAAHEAARAQLPPNYVDPEHTGENRKLLEVFYLACEAEGGTADEIILRGLRAAIAADRAARPRPTPEEVEARFRTWWGECYPNVPAGPHAVRSHVAFALHLLGGEVQ